MATIEKIAFIGESGSGKNTSADIFKDILKKENTRYLTMNVAEPLHEIQDHIYTKFNKSNNGQDPKLLSFLASHFEDEIVNRYKNKVESVIDTFYKISWFDKVFIINSDCRNNSFLILKNLGFKFVRVQTEDVIRNKRLKQRDGVIFSSRVDATNDIKEDYIIYNNRDIVYLKKQLYTLWKKW